MWLRKSLGLLLAFTMAHVAMVGSDLGCDRHAAGATHAADMGAMHHDEGTAQHTAPDKKPCDVPASPKCCEAVTSCAIAVTLGSSAVVYSIPSVATVVVSFADEIPLSRIVAPDPPPPKA
jgi:hypothetical protein